jgi:glucose-6-phosphate isomerase, archaeal
VLLNPSDILKKFDQTTGRIDGCPLITRRLSDLKGLFLDTTAYESALTRGDPVIYTVSSWDSAHGGGQLHCGLGVIMPGKIGDEFFFTKGHLHSWREAAEIYIGFQGKGMMILQEETTDRSVVADLVPDSTVYVPNHTAHRTVNVGDSPLVYLGIYPSEAGHDYEAISKNNFRKVVLAGDNGPVVLDRADGKTL